MPRGSSPEVVCGFFLGGHAGGASSDDDKVPSAFQLRCCPLLFVLLFKMVEAEGCGVSIGRMAGTDTARLSRCGRRHSHLAPGQQVDSSFCKP